MDIARKLEPDHERNLHEKASKEEFRKLAAKRKQAFDVYIEEGFTVFQATQLVKDMR